MAHEFMTSNVYLPRGRILIAGSCLEQVYPAQYAELAAGHDSVWTLCLEQTHINMAITKLSAVLGTGQVEAVTIASVDRSPHCTQLHYMCHEIERIMPVHCPVKSLVVTDRGVTEVSPGAIELSKSLSLLTELSQRVHEKQ